MLRRYAATLTTGTAPRELVSTKAYAISAKAHGIDAGAYTLVCSLARCPARFLVRSLGLVRAERARIGANRSTARGGLGGLYRRGSHGEARRGGEEGRLRRRLQLGGDRRHGGAHRRIREEVWMLARHTCFCGALPSAMIASSWRRSTGVTFTTMPALIPRA